MQEVFSLAHLRCGGLLLGPSAGHRPVRRPQDESLPQLPGSGQRHRLHEDDGAVFGGGGGVRPPSRLALPEHHPQTTRQT